MRSGGIWHPRLSQLVTAVGHGELIVVADAGLPVPPGVEPIDLLWRRGEPPLLPVVEALLAECVVEAATVADELVDVDMSAGLTRLLGGIPVGTVPHEHLKRLTGSARAIVRTGEAIPYANVVLRAGVGF